MEAQQVAALAGIGRFAEFDAGRVIFQQGDPTPGMYIVDSGQVRVYKLASTGKEHVLHVAGPGQTFAEVAVLGGFDLPAFAQATESTRCVLLPTGPLNAQLDNDPKLCRTILAGLSMWVRQLVGLLEDIVLRDAAGRVARYLLDQSPDPNQPIELPMLKKHLASHLNLTSETLSRVLRRLEEDDLIAAPDNTIHLTNPRALRDMVDGVYPTL